MTNKELLYTEDALGHEQFLEQRCKEAGQALTDPQLKAFVAQMETKHKEIFNQFINLV